MLTYGERFLHFTLGYSLSAGIPIHTADDADVTILVNVAHIVAITARRAKNYFPPAGIPIHNGAVDDVTIRVNVACIVVDVVEVRRAKFDFYLDNDSTRRNPKTHSSGCR